MALIDDNITQNPLICNVFCSDVMLQSANRSSGADLVDAQLSFLLSDRWIMTRVGVAVCLAIASLTANGLLLLDVLRRQLADNDTYVGGNTVGLPSYITQILTSVDAVV